MNRLRYSPYTLLRFLRIRLVSRPQPVFAVLITDRKQRLLRFAWLFRGDDSLVRVHTKEVVREAIACRAEQILCVREDARRVKRAMELLDISLMDCVTVGELVTSHLQRRVI